MRYLTDKLFGRSALLAAVLALAACASQPQAPAPARQQAASTPLPLPAEAQRDYSDAQTLLSVEDFDGAAQILEPFVRNHPQYPAAAVTLAIAWRELGRSDDALALLETTLAGHDGYAPGWNQVGILHREAGRFGDAEAAYLKAVTVSPDYALAHFNFGILLDLYLGRHEQALTHYQRFQELAPEQDREVDGWIADISRRIERATRAAQVAQ